MPLVRIDLPSGTPEHQRRAIGSAVQEALHGALGVPLQERFQVVVGHAADNLIIDPDYLGVQRSLDAIVVQITLNKGRDATQKRAFFSAAVEALERLAGVRPADVVISLVEVAREDWSFGNGEAQLA